jgi:hypothetical protein
MTVFLTAMRIFLLLALAIFIVPENIAAQPRREDIYSDFVVFSKRKKLDADLRENVIGKTFALPLDKDNEFRFESACRAISQFQVKNEIVDQGFQKLFSFYDSLDYDTRRALLEAVYAVYPTEYKHEVHSVLNRESDPKLFAMSAVYLSRIDSSTENLNNIKIRMVEQFPTYDSTQLLIELEKYLNRARKIITPPVNELIRFQQQSGNKVIYSFQRWNRDYPGLAIVQNADGSFVRREDGRIMVFQQLARSGSSLPYFLTNGNTPQGIYRITGTGVARNKLIGPTPNIQLIMPYEDSLEKFFQYKWDSSIAPLTAYNSLLPLSWKNYEPIREAYYAGKIGRTEIIAHGTTIDPEYFKDQPYYPLTPTQGCLCAKELWNVSNGKLLISEQYNLFSSFLSQPGNKGYLFVINIDDQQKPVTREEIERFLK